MVAFQVDSKEIVDAVHQKALELGGVNEGAPGPRPADGNVYYCYFRDLDGNKICAYANL
jgi:predicted lactoylglutathione lyase